MHVLCDSVYDKYLVVWHSRVNARVRAVMAAPGVLGSRPGKRLDILNVIGKIKLINVLTITCREHEEHLRFITPNDTLL